MGPGMSERSRAARLARSAIFFCNRTFVYKRALFTAWSIMSWEQRLHFRRIHPELAKTLPVREPERSHPEGPV